MERFSEYLRTHRERKGIQLEEIASITKIHVRNLELMESGQWHELPPEPFIRGFIIAYAKYVGLDGKDALERFYAESRPLSAPSGADDEPGTSPELAAEVIEQSRGIPFGAIGAGFALTLVFVVAGALIYIGGREGEPGATTTASTDSAAPVADGQRETAASAAAAATKAAVPDVQKQAGDTAKAGASTVTGTTTAPPVPEVQRTPLPPGFEHEVSIALGKKSWVKTVIDSEKPKEAILPEGEKLTVIAKKRVKVVIANAEGARVMHNGVLQEGIAVRGTLRTYRFPSNAQFPQDVPPPPKERTNEAERSQSSEAPPPAAAPTAEAPATE